MMFLRLANIFPMTINSVYTHYIVYAILNILIFYAGLIQAKAEVYRWKDPEGNYHYSDKFTPDEAPNDRHKIDPDGKRPDQYIPGEKTPDYFEREKRLKELRREQLNRLVEERAHDDSLMRTYRNEEEMKSALDGRLATVDGLIKVTLTNQERWEQQLRNLQAQAANLERHGQPVQKGLRDNIDATNRQIAAYREKVRNLELDKTNLITSFNADLARFRYLLNRRSNISQALFDWTEPVKHAQEEPIVSAIKCQTAEVCARIWSLAKSYLEQASNKQLVTENRRLMRTEAPVEDNDIAVIVIRVVGKDADTLFFDIRCRNSSIGDELCVSSKANDIRNGFEPFIRKGLGLAPK